LPVPRPAFPLAGLRVLDLAGVIAAPFAAKLLADLGANVLKVEPPGGDAARSSGPFPGDRPDAERSTLFLYLNTNKRGVTLDRSRPTGGRILAGLVAHYNLVLAEAPPPDGLPPGTIWCAVTPYGLTGPRADWSGAEVTEYASGGLMYITGEYAREP